MLHNSPIIVYVSISRPDRKTINRLSEKLTSLGEMGVQLRTPLKPPNTTVLWRCKGYQGEVPWCQETLILFVFCCFCLGPVARLFHKHKQSPAKAPSFWSQVISQQSFVLASWLDHLYTQTESGKTWIGLELDWNIEKYSRNLNKSTRNQIVFTIFWLIWNINGRVCLCSKSIKIW